MGTSTKEGRAPLAHARSSDPETSHRAAAALGDIRASQREVLQLFRRYGPMTDKALVEAAEHAGVKQSASGLRTRRHELVELALVIDTGRRMKVYHKTERVREHIIWKLAGEE